MIDNYLDFAKRERKRLLKKSKVSYRGAETATYDWLRGYYRGKMSAELCASWRWRELQKDIEATLSVVAEIYSPACTDPILCKFDF